MQITFMAEEGVTIAEIARRHGVSRQTVYNHLKRTVPYPAYSGPSRPRIPEDAAQ